MLNKLKLKWIGFSQKKIDAYKNRANSSVVIYHRIAWIFALSVILLSLAGCYRSVSPQFYTLTPKLTPLASSPVKLIEVLPVGLPQRLDTSLMVLQKSNGVSYMLDQQRWTSSLSDELHSGLSAGLQQKLGAIDVYQNGLTGGKTWYTIATEFSRFDIVEHADKAATDIEVMAAWVIKRHDASPNKLSQGQYPHQLSCRMNFKNSVDSGKDFVDIVKSYQNSLNRVIDAIAISTLAVDTKQQPAIEGVICF